MNLWSVRWVMNHETVIIRGLLRSLLWKYTTHVYTLATESNLLLVTMKSYFFVFWWYRNIRVFCVLVPKKFHFFVFWCQRNISVNILHDLWPISKVLRAQGSHLWYKMSKTCKQGQLNFNQEKSFTLGNYNALQVLTNLNQLAVCLAC